MPTTLTSNVILLLAAVAFWAYCLIDFSRTDERDMRTFSKPVWLVLLVFCNLVGGLLWLSAGRPRGAARR